VVTVCLNNEEDVAVHDVVVSASLVKLVCVCVYTSYHPEIWHGLLISPRLGTKLGGDPKC
jgi:hypothetical protein